MRTALFTVAAAAVTLMAFSLLSAVPGGAADSARALASHQNARSWSLSAHCHARQGHTLRPLPDPRCTPGRTWSRVTQADIRSTICKPGWTSTIRPPESYTEKLKIKEIMQYGYQDQRLGDYEEDHLIPLELGGAPKAIRNLWPEYDNGHIPNKKDAVENALNHAVCSGKVKLRPAQRAIAKDWKTAEKKLGIGL